MDNYKKQKKKLIIKVTASVLALAFVLTVSTFSWFNQGSTANVGNVDVNVSGAISMSGSSDGTNYTNSIKIDLSNQKVLKQYSSNGINFYEPIFGPKNEIIAYSKVDFTKEEKGFIEFELSFKSKDAYRLFLAPGSEVYPIDRKNKADYICGAVRVGFISSAYSYIWIPNTTYEYDKANYEIIENGQVESEYIFADSSDLNATRLTASDIYTVTTNNQPSGVDPSGRIFWGDIGTIENYYDLAMPIIRTPATENETVNSFKVRIWIEGNDRETHNDLLEGKFSFNLKFIATEIKE